MRVIAHLSDLHFGRTDPAVLPAVIAAVTAAKPDLVVISGDLTQRARSHEFNAARAFLDRLPRPQIVVPGNHDVPLWNVFARWRRSLHKYRRIITDDLEPFHVDGKIAVLGLNTARAFTIKDGRINRGQASRARAHFAACGPDVIRIVVTHHPFDQPEAEHSGDIVGRAGMAMTAFAEAGVDMILSGHLHLARAGHSAIRYPGRAALFVQAGTATSTRQRGETNSFNLLRIEGKRVTITRMDWHAAEARFIPAIEEAFTETEQGWRAEEAQQP